MLGHSSTGICGQDFLQLQNKWANEEKSETQTTSLYHSNFRPEPLPSSVISVPKSVSPTNPNNNPQVTQVTTAPTYQYQLAQQLPFHDHLLEELTPGKEWDGCYVFNPKAGDPLCLNTRVYPVNTSLDLPTATDPALIKYGFSSLVYWDLRVICATRNLSTYHNNILINSWI